MKGIGGLPIYHLVSPKQKFKATAGGIISGRDSPFPPTSLK